ncbi:unnamed protein product [Alopecurus aequalis]
MARGGDSSRAATPAADGDYRKRKRDQGGRSLGNSTPQSPPAGGSLELQLVVAAQPAPASARSELAQGHETASSSRPHMTARRPRSSGSGPSGGMRQLELGSFFVDTRNSPQVEEPPQDPPQPELPRDEDEQNVISEEEEEEDEDDDEEMFDEDDVEEMLVSDPALRQQIDDYHPDLHEEVRRSYLLKGPTRPVLTNYPRKHYGGNTRSCSRQPSSK